MAKIIKKITGLKPNQNYLVSFKAKNTELSAVDEPYPSIRMLTPTDSSIPSAIDNNTFFIYGNYKSVMFTFEPTVDIDVDRYKYELYSDSAGTNLISSGYATSSVFTIDVPNNSGAAEDADPQNNVKYYGRIKTVDTSNNESGWTPSSGLKESSETVLIESSHIRNLTASKITAGTINAHEIILKQQGAQTSITAPANMAIIRSSNYNGSYNNSTLSWTPATNGWVIGGDGYAEFATANIRGTIRASSLYIDANNRWKTDTSGNEISTAQFKVGSSTKYLYFDGTDLTFTGNLSAASGTFTGSLQAASGTFSGDVSGSTFIGGLIESNDASTTINLNDGTFSLGGGSLTWNGTTLAVTGQISATSGSIGGWIIESNKLRANSTDGTNAMTFTSTGNADGFGEIKRSRNNNWKW